MYSAIILLYIICCWW